MQVKQKNKISIYFSLILIVLFLINPLISILLGVFFVSITSKEVIYSNNVPKTVIVLCVLFVCCMNAQKVPASDLEGYVRVFHNATKLSLFEFLSDTNNKEPAFYTLTWCINRLTFSNEFCYKFIISLLCYIFLNIAVYKFFYRICRDVRLLLFGIILVNFIPYIFISSMHLIRQYLAASLFMFVLVDKLFYNKRHYFFVILMLFIHSTTFLFIPFLFWNSLGKPFRECKGRYIIILVLLFSVQLVSSFLIRIPFIGETIFAYALNRASKRTTFDLGEMSFFQIGLVFLLFILSYIVAYIKIKTIKPNFAIKHFFNIICLLCLFILSVHQQSELSMRFLFYTYLFIPFIAITLFRNAKKSVTRLFPFISVFLIIFWVYYLEEGPWTYLGSSDVWRTPLFLYFF